MVILLLLLFLLVDKSSPHRVPVLRAHDDKLGTTTTATATAIVTPTITTIATTPALTTANNTIIGAASPAATAGSIDATTVTNLDITTVTNLDATTVTNFVPSVARRRVPDNICFFIVVRYTSDNWTEAYLQAFHAWVVKSIFVFSASAACLFTDQYTNKRKSVRPKRRNTNKTAGIKGYDSLYIQDAFLFEGLRRQTMLGAVLVVQGNGNPADHLIPKILIILIILKILKILTTLITLIILIIRIILITLTLVRDPAPPADGGDPGDGRLQGPVSSQY
jgi:hypothetical protein